MLTVQDVMKKSYPMDVSMGVIQALNLYDTLKACCNDKIIYSVSQAIRKAGNETGSSDDKLPFTNEWTKALRLLKNSRVIPVAQGDEKVFYLISLLYEYIDELGDLVREEPECSVIAADLHCELLNLLQLTGGEIQKFRVDYDEENKKYLLNWWLPKDRTNTILKQALITTLIDATKLHPEIFSQGRMEYFVRFWNGGSYVIRKLDMNKVDVDRIIGEAYLVYSSIFLALHYYPGLIHRSEVWKVIDYYLLALAKRNPKYKDKKISYLYVPHINTEDKDDTLTISTITVNNDTLASEGYRFVDKVIDEYLETREHTLYAVEAFKKSGKIPLLANLEVCRYLVELLDKTEFTSYLTQGMIGEIYENLSWELPGVHALTDAEGYTISVGDMVNVPKDVSGYSAYEDVNYLAESLNNLYGEMRSHFRISDMECFTYLYYYHRYLATLDDDAGKRDSCVYSVHLDTDGLRVTITRHYVGYPEENDSSFENYRLPMKIAYEEHLTKNSKKE